MERPGKGVGTFWAGTMRTDQGLGWMGAGWGLQGGGLAQPRPAPPEPWEGGGYLLGWRWGRGQLGRGLGRLGPAPRSSLRPRGGVLRVKRHAGEQGCTCAAPGWSAAATGRAGSRAFRAGLGSLAPGTRTPTPTRTRPGTPTPTWPGPAPVLAPRADGLLLPQFVRLLRGGHGGVRLRRLRRLQPARRLPVQPAPARLPRGRAALPRARLLQLRAWRPARPPARALLGR